MRISVFGLGYVGAVSAACLAADGHTVVGVDTNPVKVDLLNQGHAPVVEAGLGELIEEGVRAGRLRATTDCDAAVAGTDIGLVCVGTPSKGQRQPRPHEPAPGGRRHRAGHPAPSFAHHGGRPQHGPAGHDPRRPAARARADRRPAGGGRGVPRVPARGDGHP